MWYFLLKTLLTALLVATISALSRRYSSVAALLAALPLTSLLAFVWMYAEGQPLAEVATLSRQIFWLVLPSLLLFVLLPLLLKWGWSFWPALLTAMLATSGAYGLMLPLLRKFGIF